MSRCPPAAGGTWTSHSSAANGTGESGLSERRGVPARIEDRQVHLERGRPPRVSPASCPINLHHLADRVRSRLAGGDRVRRLGPGGRGPRQVDRPAVGGAPRAGSEPLPDPPLGRASLAGLQRARHGPEPVAGRPPPALRLPPGPVGDLCQRPAACRDLLPGRQLDLRRGSRWPTPARQARLRPPAVARLAQRAGCRGSPGSPALGARRRPRSRPVR